MNRTGTTRSRPSNASAAVTPNEMKAKVSSASQGAASRAKIELETRAYTSLALLHLSNKACPNLWAVLSQSFSQSAPAQYSRYRPDQSQHSKLHSHILIFQGNPGDELINEVHTHAEYLAKSLYIRQI
jgi:hypothetical protein